MKQFLWISRILVGVLFIFSGLIKANDPLGLSYKMEEFFEVLHLHALIPLSLTLSLVMNAFEIVAGFAVLLGYRMRLFAFLLLILILFFTFLTGFALFSGLIRECGCFGDCIKLTADQSFWKDILLLVLILFIYRSRNQIQPSFSPAITVGVMVFSFVLSIGLQWYTLRHLPIVDCLPYKIGNNIPEKMQPPAGATHDVFSTVLIYKKDGVEKEFTLDNYPWEDSTWVFVDRKDKLIQQGNAIPEIKDFILTDYDGNNLTQMILSETRPVYLLLVRDPAIAGKGWESKIQRMQDQWYEGAYAMYGVTSASESAIENFKKDRSIEIPFLQMDGVAIKTAGRSTPCLLLIENGTIINKWHYNDIP
jgi:uncharacterized membrane protein YphA (DoxX/SURF4 family)